MTSTDLTIKTQEGAYDYRILYQVCLQKLYADIICDRFNCRLDFPDKKT